MLGHFQDAIERELISYYHFQPSKAKKEIAVVRKKLSEVIFVFSRQSDNLSLFSPSDQNHIINEFDRICGTFSDNDNAFAINNIAQGKSVMIICPGAYLRQELESAIDFNPVEILPRISGTIFHELSHFLNTSSSFSLNEFVKSRSQHDNSVRGLEWCQKEHFNLSSPILNNYSGFRSEIEADVIGNIAFGNYLKSSCLSTNQKLDLIKIAYGDICGTTDSVPHPGADFRLNELLLKTPEIFYQFKCYRAYENTPMVGCSVSGYKTLNLAF